MTAEQLVADVLDVYAQCGTYRDMGRLLKYFMPVGYDVGRRPSTVEFRTAYARPGRLRFEQRHLHANGKCFAHMVSWANGSEVRRWSHPNHSHEPPTDLAGAFSFAVHNVHPVLELLTEGRVEWYLTNLTQMTRLADESLDGAACHRLRCRCSWWGQTPTPEEQALIEAFFRQVTGRYIPPGRTVYPPLTVWIDCRTRLVRRIESGLITERATYEEVMTCQPEIGVSLDPAELAFDPPDTIDTSGGG